MSKILFMPSLLSNTADILVTLVLNRTTDKAEEFFEIIGERGPPRLLFHYTVPDDVVSTCKRRPFNSLNQVMLSYPLEAYSLEETQPHGIVSMI